MRLVLCPMKRASWQLQLRLSQVRRLPLNELKIDRSFVTALEEDESQAVFVEIIVALALALGLEIVAEGIENARQAEILAGFGAQIGQGYLFGKPMSAEDLVLWAKKRYPNAGVIEAPQPQRRKKIAAKVVRKTVGV